MRRRDLALGLGALPVMLTGGVAAAAAAPPDLRAKFDRLLARYTAAWKAGDGAALAALYAPDVHW